MARSAKLEVTRSKANVSPKERNERQRGVEQNPRQWILRRVMTQSVKLEVAIAKLTTSAAQEAEQSWSKIQERLELPFRYPHPYGSNFVFTYG